MLRKLQEDVDAREGGWDMMWCSAEVRRGSQDRQYRWEQKSRPGTGTPPRTGARVNALSRGYPEIETATKSMIDDCVFFTVKVRGEQH
jgi:hypothetical protein